MGVKNAFWWIYVLYCWLLHVAFYLPCLQEEQNTVPLSTLLEVVNTVRSFGNRCFNQSRYDNAKDRYKQVNLDGCLRERNVGLYFLFHFFFSANEGAMSLFLCVLVKVKMYFVMDSMFGPKAMMLLRNRETKSNAEKERIKTALLPLYLNLSLTELRLESPHKALKYGNKALEIDSANTKALFRCGKVRRGFCVCLFSKPSDKNPWRSFW